MKRETGSRRPRYFGSEVITGAGPPSVLMVPEALHGRGFPIRILPGTLAGTQQGRPVWGCDSLAQWKTCSGETGMNRVGSHRNHENRSDGSPLQGPSRGTAGQIPGFLYEYGN